MWQGGYEQEDIHDGPATHLQRPKRRGPSTLCYRHSSILAPGVSMLLDLSCKSLRSSRKRRALDASDTRWRESFATLTLLAAPHSTRPPDKWEEQHEFRVGCKQGLRSA